MDQQTEEGNFRRSGSFSFSPKGHLYQLSYAVEAAKHSTGVLFLKKPSGYIAFKCKEPYSELYNGLSPYELFLQDTYFDPQNKFLVYFMGHKHVVPEIRETLERILKQRALYVKVNFPGLHSYVKNCLAQINSNHLYKHRLSGLTTLIFTQDELSKVNSTLLRPNNRWVQSSVLTEGNLSEEQSKEILNFFNTRKAFSVPLEQTTLFNEEFYLKDLSCLQEFKAKKTAFEVYDIDFEKGTILPIQ